jgi:hypothetical protein
VLCVAEASEFPLKVLDRGAADKTSGFESTSENLDKFILEFDVWGD